MARHRTVGGWSSFVDKIFHGRSSKVHIRGSRCLIGRGDDPRTVGANGGGPDCGPGTAIRGRTSIIVTHELSFARDAAALIQQLDMDILAETWLPPVGLLDSFFKDRLPHHGLGRGFKVDKESIAGLLVA